MERRPATTRARAAMVFVAVLAFVAALLGSGALAGEDLDLSPVSDVGELIAFIDGLGVLDGEGPVRVETPLAPGMFPTLESFFVFLQETGVRTVVEPSAAALALAIDRAVAVKLRSLENPPIRLGYRKTATEPLLEGARQFVEITVRNEGTETFRDVTVHLVESALLGSLRGLPEPGGGPIVHTLRVPRGNLAHLRIGDLDAGKTRAVTGHFEAPSPAPDVARHYYWLVTYDGEGGMPRGFAAGEAVEEARRPIPMSPAARTGGERW